MKKLISILLCMTLLFGGTFAVNVLAETETPKTDAELYSHALEVLKGVGVLDNDFDLNGEGYVTYREYVTCLARLTGNSEAVICEMFKIPETSLDEVLTYENAMEIMVKLLGWEYKAQKNGVLSVAASHGLNDGVLNIENFARYDMVMVINNALNADFLDQVGFGTKSEYTSKDKSILGVYRDIKEVSGVLCANKWSAIYSAEGLGTDAVTIKTDDGVSITFDYFGTASMDLLGAYVKGYYKSNGSKDEVISLWNDDDQLIINPNQNPSYDASAKKITYTDEKGKDKEIAVPADVTIVVNGRSYTDPAIINDTTVGNLGTITLYKVNNKYKAIHVEFYTNGVSENVGKIGSRIALKDAGTIELNSSEYGESIFFYDQNKKPITYSDVKVGEVISIFKSINNGSEKPIIKILAYNNKKSAKLLSTRNDGFDDWYEFADVATDNDGNVTYGESYEGKISFGTNAKLVIGNTYEAYFDLYGRVVYAQTSHTSDGRLTGLYIKIGPGNATFESDYKIMMMPDLDSKVQEGGKIVKLAKKAKVDYEEDGIRKEELIKNVDLAKLNQLLMHTAMYYYTNSDGEVTKIIGYSTTGENGYLFNFNPNNEKLYTHTIASVSGKYYVECSKHYWTAATYYGGDESATTSMDANDPTTFYGKKYIKYLGVSDQMIVLPKVSSTDEISADMFRDYYKKVPVVKYGMISKSDYLVYNAFSHDGGILPDYGTVVYDSKEMTEISKYYHFYGSFAKYLVNKVSYVSSENGGKVYKFNGLLNSTQNTTLYSESDKIIDIAKSSPDELVYFDEISEGDFMFVQCNSNGEITMALKMCDYDPENDIVSIPFCPNLKRIYYDEASGQMVNDVEKDGVMDIIALSSQRVCLLGYAYKSADGGFSYIADKNALLSSPDPMKAPSQYEYQFGGGTVSIYHTKQKAFNVKRAFYAGQGDAVAYSEDPEDMSRVFTYINLGEVACSVIYR